MALLRARGTLVAGAVALLSLVLTGCEGASEMGKIELDLYPVDVECDATSLECRDARGDVAVPAHYDTWMFASTETSSFEDGLFMTFELPTERGVAYVELDLPRHSDAETAGTFSYRELRGPERVFESTSARGGSSSPRTCRARRAIAATDGSSSSSSIPARTARSVRTTTPSAVSPARASDGASASASSLAP